MPTGLDTLDATHQMYRDTDLQIHTTYRYQISAIDHHGNESVLSPIRAVTTTDFVLLPPTDLRVRYNAAVHEVNVTWVAPDKYDHFVVQRAVLVPGTSIRDLETSDFTSFETEDPITTTSYSDSTISSGCHLCLPGSHISFRTDQWPFKC